MFEKTFVSKISHPPPPPRLEKALVTHRLRKLYIYVVSRCRNCKACSYFKMQMYTSIHFSMILTPIFVVFFSFPQFLNITIYCFIFLPSVLLCLPFLLAAVFRNFYFLILFTQLFSFLYLFIFKVCVSVFTSLILKTKCNLNYF